MSESPLNNLFGGAASSNRRTRIRALPGPRYYFCDPHHTSLKCNRAYFYDYPRVLLEVIQNMRPRRQSMRLQSRTSFTREAPRAFCNLPQDIIDEFESLQAISEYREGSILYQQGQECAGVFRLCRGRAKLKITGRHGKAAIVKIAGTNELLGLCEALTGRKYLLTAEIIEFSSAAFIRREQLLQLMSRNVAVANRITQQLAYEYFELFDESRCLRLGSSASQRLANLIVQWAGKSTSGPRLIEISNTHSEIAQMIGCSRETVTRLLHDFQQQRLISFDHAAMYIDDLKTLRQLALS